MTRLVVGIGSGAIDAPAAARRRRTALIGLMAVSGMRVSEACGLDRSDVELPERRLTVGHATNGRSREIRITPARPLRSTVKFSRARTSCAYPQDPVLGDSHGGARGVGLDGDELAGNDRPSNG